MTQASSLESAEPARDAFLGMAPGWQKRTLYVALGVSPLAAGMFLKIPLCPTAGMLGIPCPGCGLTRATLAALHGHFAQALHFHPLVFLVTPVYLGVISSLAFGYIRGGMRPPSKRWGKVVTGLAIFLFASLMSVWIARFFGAFGGPVAVDRF